LSPNPNFTVPFQVDLHVREFEKLIKAHGHCVTWEKATICPCSTPDGRDNLICAKCSGQGWYYFGATPTTVLLTSLSAMKAFSEVGVAGDWVLGKVSVTAAAGINLGFRDRITSLDSQITFSELVIVGRDDLRYDVLSVEMVATEAADLVEGTDYNVVNGKIIFVTPAADTVVSVRYQAHPSWIILDALHEIRDTTHADGKFLRAPRAHIASLDYIMNAEV